MLRKIIVSVVCLLSVCSMHAQFNGGFDCKDPDAWFDTEIFFICQNACVYYGYPQNVQNAAFLVNDEDWYTIDNWQYGTYVTITDGLKKNSTVALYINNQYITTWTCYSATPSLTGRLWDKYNKDIKKGIVKGVVKGVFKLAKYLK